MSKKKIIILSVLTLLLLIVFYLFFSLKNYLDEVPVITGNTSVYANTNTTLSVDELAAFEHAVHYGIQNVAGSKTAVISDDKQSLTLGPDAETIFVTVYATGKYHETREATVEVNVIVGD